jgi:PAP2 superfamily
VRCLRQPVLDGPGTSVDQADASARPEPGGRSGAPGRSTRPSLVREVVLIAGLFLVYRLGRLAITGHDDLAITNAWWVWDVERTLRLPDEELFQQWALQWPDLLRAANWYYVGVHFPLTAAFLIWGWLRRPPEEYRYARRLLSLLTGLALIVHVVMPLAPPRMLSSLGFLDTMAVFGPSAYGDSSATVANQFAAMPSLHVGWALLIAIVVVQTAHSRWRWIAVFHPLLTIVVVVATANHYWVDAIAAALLLLVAIVVVPQPYGPSFLSRWSAAWRNRSSARPTAGVDAGAGSEGSSSARRTGGLDGADYDGAGLDGGGFDDPGSDYQPVRGSVTSGRELSSASSGSAVSSSSGDCPPRPRPPSE